MRTNQNVIEQKGTFTMYELTRLVHSFYNIYYRKVTLFSECFRGFMHCDIIALRWKIYAMMKMAMHY